MYDWKSCCKGGMHPQIGLVLLRLAVALPFLYAGWWKLANAGMANGMFVGFGFPNGFGTLIGLVEVIGGIMLVLGAYVAIVSYVLIAVMVAAIYLVTGKMGFATGYQINVILILALLALAKLGAGEKSVDAKRGMGGIVADCCGGGCGEACGDGACGPMEGGCCDSGMCEMPGGDEHMVLVEDGEVVAVVEEPKA
jgi:putative oxidoreductase